VSRRFAAASAALVCSLAVASAPVAASASAGSTPTKVEVYTLKDSGRSVSVLRGKTFRVRLQNCGDCGEQWVISTRPRPRVLSLVSRHETSTAKPPAVGGENHTIWTFRADEPGRTTMAMSEHSAEKGGKVIKRFRLTVTVHTPVG
jgi:predicted secreted protein